MTERSIYNGVMGEESKGDASSYTSSGETSMEDIMARAKKGASALGVDMKITKVEDTPVSPTPESVSKDANNLVVDKDPKITFSPEEQAAQGHQQIMLGERVQAILGDLDNPSLSEEKRASLRAQLAEAQLRVQEANTGGNYLSTPEIQARRQREKKEAEALLTKLHAQAKEENPEQSAAQQLEEEQAKPPVEAEGVQFAIGELPRNFDQARYETYVNDSIESMERQAGTRRITAEDIESLADKVRLYQTELAGVSINQELKDRLSEKVRDRLFLALTEAATKSPDGKPFEEAIGKLGVKGFERLCRIYDQDPSPANAEMGERLSVAAAVGLIEANAANYYRGDAAQKAALEAFFVTSLRATVSVRPGVLPTEVDSKVNTSLDIAKRLLNVSGQSARYSGPVETSVCALYPPGHPLAGQPDLSTGPLIEDQVLVDTKMAMLIDFNNDRIRRGLLPVASLPPGTRVLEDERYWSGLLAKKRRYLPAIVNPVKVGGVDTMVPARYAESTPNLFKESFYLQDTLAQAGATKKKNYLPICETRVRSLVQMKGLDSLSQMIGDMGSPLPPNQAPGKMESSEFKGWAAAVAGTEGLKKALLEDPKTLSSGPLGDPVGAAEGKKDALVKSAEALGKVAVTYDNLKKFYDSPLDSGVIDRAKTAYIVESMNYVSKNGGVLADDKDFDYAKWEEGGHLLKRNILYAARGLAGVGSKDMDAILDTLHVSRDKAAFKNSFSGFGGVTLKYLQAFAAGLGFKVGK